MALEDLIKAKEAAIAADVQAAGEEIVAEALLLAAKDKHVQTAADRAATHKAIHDVLVEFGEHYLLDEDGTCTVYKPVDQSPGYLAVQPVPGNGPPTSTS